MRPGPFRLCSRACFVLLLSPLLPSCTMLPPIDFERMIYQDKFVVWQAAPYFEDGRVMRTPPEGTVPRGAPVDDPALTRGVVDGAYVDSIPLPATHELLAAGRARFETYCAPCHGLLGDGRSTVALNMDLRKPPAIAGRAARRLESGRIYQVIHEGYGLMRSYSEDLISPEERWAVVAYLQALQLSQGVPLASLPQGERQEAERQLR